MATVIHNLTPEILFSRRAYQRSMARSAKAFSAISLGAAFAFTASEAAAVSARGSLDDKFTTIDGTALGFTDDGSLRLLLASTGEEIVIPRGKYGLVGDQIMVSELIDGVEIAQNGYIPPTSDAYPTYAAPGFFAGMGYGGILIPVGLVAAGILVYIAITRADNTAPKFAAATYTASVAENTAATTTVLAAPATDAEKDTITYSLSGTDAEHFTVDASGNIKFNQVANFEAPGDSGFNNVYSFIVTATDDHGEASSSTVTVTVTDAAGDVSTQAPVGGAYTGDANAQDLKSNAKITAASDLGAGNDFFNLDKGIAAVKLDMGSGNDKVLVTTTVIDTGATIDLGTGNDEVEFDFNATGANVIIELGGGADVIDIDAAQTGNFTVKDFGTDDLIDVDNWKNFTVDLNGGVAWADTAAASAGAGTDEITFFYNASTGHTDVYADDGTDTVKFTLENYSGFSAADLIL